MQTSNYPPPNVEILNRLSGLLESSSPEGQDELIRELEQLIAKARHVRTVKKMSAKAAANGLTSEILEQLLAE